jgi:diguanylate cyclase (GGDEF)-like protein
MEIRFYLKTIQRGWWLILVSMLIAVNISLVYSFYYITPMYETVARFIVSPEIQAFDQIRDLANSIEALDKRSIVATYAEIINSNQIFANNLQLLDQNPEDYVDYITSVVVLPEANIIELKVQGPNPEVVAFLANTIGQHAINFIVDLYQVYDISFIDTAVIPEEPYRPKPFQDGVLALIIGAAFGGILAILREQLSSSLESLTRRRMTDAESLAYTRNYFEQKLRNSIETQPKGDLSLGFVYLSGLQEIFDSLPQAYVNNIMRHITDTLKYQLRGNDIVGRWSRLGFSILLPTTPGNPATRTLARIRTLLDQPYSLDPGGEVTVDLDPRIGVSTYKEGEPIGDLVSRAEQALELARQSDEKINYSE